MKQFKAILALLLAALLVVGLFTACASSEGAGDNGGQTADSGKDTGTSTGDKAPVNDTQGGEDEELTEIVFYRTDPNTGGATEEAHRQAIEDAINAITEPAIGVHVKLKMSQTAEYMTGMPLDLAGGEVLDVVGVFPMAPINLTSMYTANQLMDISPYLDEYGQDILEAVGDYLGAVTISGGVYMVPNVRNYASSEYMIWIKDWIDELGLAEKVQTMTTWAEFEEVCAAIYEKYGVAALAAKGDGEDTRVLVHGTGGITMSGTGSFDNALITDNIGDNLYCLATDQQSNKVYNYYTDQHFVDACETAKRWYDNGWVYADAAHTSDDVAVQVTNEVAAGYIVTSEMGVETAKQNMCGHALYATKLADAYVTSGVVTRFGLGVTTNSEEPEAAVKFLNLLMTSGELNDLLFWGIEGEDWVENDQGEAALTENSQFHGADFMLGNAFLAHPWEGNGGDYRARCKEANDAAPISNYLGFALDTSGMDNTVAGITAVQSEYMPGLTCGMYNENDYNSFLGKLQAAGIDDYIAEAQKQLDAWLASK